MDTNERPVYVFTGFLESGKTSFIIENISNPAFCAPGEMTVVIACEDGEKQYDEVESDEIKVVYVSEQDELTYDYCMQLQQQYDPDKIIIEYNGMWNINDLYQVIPENWLIVQQINVADASTFLAYNTMFRNLMVEKIAGAEFMLFNRVNHDDDKMQYHKVVRQVNRKCEIAYEYTDGQGEYDDIVDPLPFDLNADVIDIEFRDYALWIQDVVQEYKKYIGKKIKVIAKAVPNDKLEEGSFSFGRRVMTCCVADIKFMGLVCENETKQEVKLPGWYEVEAEMCFGYQKIFKAKVPYLKAYKIKEVEIAPEDEVATFY